MMRHACTRGKFGLSPSSKAVYSAQSVQPDNGSTATAVQQLFNAVTPQVAESLKRKGYAMVDNLFGAKICADLRKEIKDLRNTMHPNNTHFVHKGDRSLLPKSHIFEADLRERSTFEAAKLFKKLQQDTSFGTMLSILLPVLDVGGSQAIKLQYNEGQGGCFPLHFDSDESVDTRRMSAIFYLNQGWKPEHGGSLRLYPSWNKSVDIAPVEDRLVLFPSCRMPHRVLPSYCERYCFTMWLSGLAPTRNVLSVPQALRQVKQGTMTIEAALHEPEIWKAIMKLRCRDEWIESLQQSHPPSAELESALQTLQRECDLIENVLGKELPGFSKGVDIKTYCKEHEVKPNWYAWMK